MNDLTERAKVILKAAVAWLLVAQVILQTIIVQVDIPVVAQYGGQALTLIAGAVLIIRRVTPVPSDERGILPSA